MTITVSSEPRPTRPTGVRVFGRRWLLTGAAGIGTTAFGVAGCSGRPGTTGSTQGTPLPRRGGTLRTADSSAVPSNYFVGTSLGGQLTSWFQFAWPLFLTSATDFEFVPGLADRYQRSADGHQHTVRLRPGLRFHDGSPLDADAVTENLRAAIFTDHPLRDRGPYEMIANGFGVPHGVKRVDAVDAVTIRIQLGTARTDVRDALSMLPILKPRILADAGYGTDLAALREGGSGPFRIARFRPEAHVEFERWEDFFEPALLDRIRFDRIQDTAQLGLGLRSGDYDVALELAQLDHKQLAADPAFRPVLSARPGKNVFLWFNPPRLPALRDRRVREAIWLALNRPAYRAAFFVDGASFPCTQPGVIAGTAAYDPEIPERPYDPEAARRLLAEAGVRDLALRITAPEAVGPLTNLRQLLEVMAADLAAVGIRLDSTITDLGTASLAWSENDFNVTAFDGLNQMLLVRLLLQGWAGGYEPPDPRADPAVRELVEAASVSVDEAEQGRLMRQAMRLHHEQLLMAIPIAMVSTSGIARAEVHDYRLAPAGTDPQHLAWIAQD